MKNRFKFSIASVLVLGSLVFSGLAFAADMQIAIPSKPAKQQVAPIASVNIQNINLISQKGNVFDISFDISNGSKIQTGVKYGVKLVSKTKTSQILTDEKVYDESLLLPENSVTSKEITYIAPATLSGTYSLVLFSSNSSGFPFAISLVKEVTLTASVKGLEIVTDTCYLKVEEDKTNTRYTLTQGVDISKDEMLRLTCTTVNHSSNTLSLKPVYETRYHSQYGDIATVTGGDTSTISFPPSKNQDFSVVLPRGEESQVYAVTVSLSGSVASNTIGAKYVVRGTSATIANVSLDKDYYSVGDKAVLSLVWAATSLNDKFVRGGASSSSPILTANIIVTNDEGKKCAETNQSLNQGEKKSSTDITLSIMSSCFNPHTSVSIKDGTGVTLDKKDFEIMTTSIQKPSQREASSNTVLVVVISILVVLAIGMVVARKRKVNN